MNKNHTPDTEKIDRRAGRRMNFQTITLHCTICQQPFTTTSNHPDAKYCPPHRLQIQRSQSAAWRLQHNPPQPKNNARFKHIDRPHRNTAWEIVADPLGDLIGLKLPYIQIQQGIKMRAFAPGTKFRNPTTGKTIEVQEKNK